MFLCTGRWHFSNGQGDQLQQTCVISYYSLSDRRWSKRADKIKSERKFGTIQAVEVHIMVVMAVRNGDNDCEILNVIS